MLCSGPPISAGKRIAMAPLQGEGRKAHPLPSSTNFHQPGHSRASPQKLKTALVTSQGKSQGQGSEGLLLQAEEAQRSGSNSAGSLPSPKALTPFGPMDFPNSTPRFAFSHNFGSGGKPLSRTQVQNTTKLGRSAENIAVIPRTCARRAETLGTAKSSSLCHGGSSFAGQSEQPSASGLESQLVS